jgi:hypothetical protein
MVDAWFLVTQIDPAAVVAFLAWSAAMAVILVWPWNFDHNEPTEGNGS